MGANKAKYMAIAGLVVLFFFILLADPACYSQTTAKKRLLIINSYHKGYTWSDIIADTIVDYFDQHAPGEAEIKKSYMDTKLNTSEEFKKNAGIKIKQLIETWKPDVIIGCDDNVSKYVIAPYFLDGDIPFVFCGLNDDPATYGFPGKNVTGIREVALIKSLYSHLERYARGRRVGYLTADKPTQRLMAEIDEKQLGRPLDKIYFVKDFEDWKKYFLMIQDEVDILLMIDVSIVPEWDKKEAIEFIQNNIKIPNGATSELSQEYVLLCISKWAKEHGTWAAEAALKILDGKKPTDIPIVVNKQGHLSVNLILADRLHIVFSPAILRAAETIIRR
ncbi:MAG: ABC transporter substrate-binding protein [Candidatus Omnitrophica bacterium]|nr:ABC transporter substrate-binding protein [Candidatus Omnitrophota bacterium]